jgi:type I restriction enzyme S subunit
MTSQKYKSYPTYKPSGIQSIGVIPQHWEVQRIDRLCDYRKTQISKSSMDKITVFHYSIPSIQEFGDGIIQAGAEIDSDKLLLQGGELLVSKLNPRKSTILIAQKHDLPTVCSPEFVPIKTIKANMNFLYYLYSSYEVREALSAIVQSATRSHQRVNPSDITKMWAAIPPEIEQDHIVNFLKQETKQIDSLLLKKQRLIELLHEKRQAMISKAVTKGFDSAVPMKDSGIEWLGEIPRHWTVSSLKYFWNVIDCKHLTAEFVVEGIPLASIREVQSRFVELNNAKQTTNYYYKQLIEGGRKPSPGDLIFSRNATVGEVAQVSDCHPPFAMGQDVCLLRRQSADYSSDYLQLVIRSNIVVEQLRNLMVGSTFKRINVDEIRNLIIPMPPAGEQVNIGTSLIQKAKIFDELVSKLEGQIGKIQEHRLAIISAAVTGKIDVREYTDSLGQWQESSLAMAGGPSE